MKERIVKMLEERVEELRESIKQENREIEYREDRIKRVDNIREVKEQIHWVETHQKEKGKTQARISELQTLKGIVERMSEDEF